MKRRIHGRMLTFVLSVICILSLWPVNAEAVHMNIRVGVKGKTPPYQFEDKDGGVAGLNVELMDLIAEKEDMTVEYVLYQTGEAAAAALMTGEVDAVLGVISSYPPEGTTLTTEISYGTVSLIAPNSNLEMITDKKAGALHYTSAFEFGTIPFSQIAQMRTRNTMVVGDQMQLFDSVVNGNVDAAVAVKESFLYQLSTSGYSDDNYTVVNNSMSSVEYHIMVRKSDTMLLRRLDDGISQLRNTSTYDEVTVQWITDESLAAARQRTKKLAICFALVVVIAALVLLIFNAWNQKLKQLVQEQTEEIRQQMLRLEQGRRLRDLLVRHFPNSLVLLQQDGTILLMNPRAEEVAELESVRWDEPHPVIRMQELEVFRQVWTETAQQRAEEMVSSAVLPITVRGTAWQYRYQYFNLNDQGDMALLLEDVTSEETQRRAMFEANKNETLNRLVAGIAHEIKNPLMSIQSFASIIREQGNERDFQESFAQYVPQEVERINRLVESLINYAKPVSGTRERVDVQNLINECVYLISASIKNKPVNLSCFNETQTYIQVNRDQIKQALLNLMLNAMEAAEERANSEKDSRPAMIISTGHENGEVILSVYDEGTGMSEETIRSCFEPFYTTKAKGTGMGLSLAKQFVMENGGELFLKSEKGKYTRITMRFKEDVEE